MDGYPAISYQTYWRLPELVSWMSHESMDLDYSNWVCTRYENHLGEELPFPPNWRDSPLLASDQTCCVHYGDRSNQEGTCSVEETQIPDEYLLHCAQGLSPMELGELVWSGYTADSYHGRARIGRFALLWAEDGEYKYQVLVWFEPSGESLCLMDCDLPAILASVTHSE